MNPDLSSLSAFEVRDGIAAREFSAAEVAAAAFSRIQSVDDDVHAVLETTRDLAEQAALVIDGLVDSGEELPPLAGVPAGIKDNMNLRGTHTTCASRILAPYRSPYDATAVRRLLDAGALPIAKLNMDEFAFGSSTENSAFGPTRNPWDVERVPGGSSGGSAAAVSAGEVVVSLGSDTGGSVRQPGALCGVVAMKPTYGRVSRYGLVAFGSSLDQIGPFSKTVRENALVLQAIAGRDAMDATSVEREPEDFVSACDAGVEGLRVGVVSDWLEIEGLQPEVRELVLASADALAGAGAEVGEVALEHAEYGLAAYYIVGPAEASSNLARMDAVRYGARVADAEDMLDLYFRSRAEGFGDESVRRIMIGTYALSAGYYDAYYGQAQKVRTVIARDFEDAFASYDVLLSPTTPTTAFEIGEKADDPLSMYLSDIFTIPVNLAGNCAVSVPVGLADGLPVGVQLIADHFAEATMLRAAAALEESVGFEGVPPLLARVPV
jgi:aspartyl-tRNA(Asn)/glutamyl-tRNA(Gln) amidotransferase subunit A